MKIKGTSVEERAQREGEGEQGGKCWGVILAKSYCYTVCMFEQQIPSLCTTRTYQLKNVERRKKPSELYKTY